MQVILTYADVCRSPLLWEKPDEFDPDRWRRPTPPELVERFNRDRPAGAPRWEGYKPDLEKTLYPNELHSDYAFLPFGTSSLFSLSSLSLFSLSLHSDYACLPFGTSISVYQAA